MQLFVGTSGYSYKEWKGSFYPEDLPAKDMLRFYAERLGAVEINNTFYQLPKPNVLESWAEQVPENFRFSLKASRRISHIKRLKDAEDETEYLLRTASVLGERLGVVLFQLPPFLRKDLERLERFLDTLPEGTHAAFEFRHASWFDDEVFKSLTQRGCALCVADTEEEPVTPFVDTAPWGYLRLRRCDYQTSDLSEWLQRIRSRNWDRAYVFFKHEDEGMGPKLAKRFLEVAG